MSPSLKSRHYNFAFEVLPAVLKEYPKELITYLLEGKSEEVKQLLLSGIESCSVYDCESDFDLSGVEIKVIRLAGCYVIFLEMPPPTEPGEAIYISCVYDTTKEQLSTKYFLLTVESFRVSSPNFLLVEYKDKKNIVRSTLKRMVLSEYLTTLEALLLSDSQSAKS